MTNKETLQSLALKIIYNHFADCDYHVDHKVILNVMVVWISELLKCLYGYDKNLNRVWLTIKLRNETRGWEILTKWRNHYWEYFRQVENEQVDRFNDLRIILSEPKAMSRTNSIRNKILDLLRSLEQVKSITFMAILTTEWARRFNTDGFLQMVQERGYSPTPVSINNGSYATVTALWFMDMGFEGY